MTHPANPGEDDRTGSNRGECGLAHLVVSAVWCEPTTAILQQDLSITRECCPSSIWYRLYREARRCDDERDAAVAILGRSRVSTNGQELTGRAASSRCSKIYQKKVSGAKTDRAEL